MPDTKVSVVQFFAAHTPQVPEWFTRRFLYGCEPDSLGVIPEGTDRKKTLNQQREAFYAWREEYAREMAQRFS